MSWEQLISIGAEAASEEHAEQARPPQSCPNDAQRLEPAPAGGLHCPFDGWTWTGPAEHI